MEDVALLVREREKGLVKKKGKRGEMSPSRVKSRLSFLFPLFEKDSNNSISGDKNNPSLFPKGPEQDPGPRGALLRGQ